MSVQLPLGAFVAHMSGADFFGLVVSGGSDWHGTTDGWRKYVGAIDDPRGAVVGIDRYGESAPAGVLFKHFGFTAENVAAAARGVVAAS